MEKAILAKEKLERRKERISSTHKKQTTQHALIVPAHKKINAPPLLFFPRLDNRALQVITAIDLETHLQENGLCIYN